MVDLSAYKIIGDFSYQTKNNSILEKLIKSRRHWDRRIAIVSTFAFIRNNSTDLVFKFAKTLLNDKEDLMH